jgi:hypothetical protein
MPSGKGRLRIAIEDFLETFQLGKVWSRWFGEASEGVEVSIMPSIDDILDAIADTPGLPNVVNKEVIKSMPKQFQGGALSLGAMAVQTGMSAASAFMAPIMRLINYKADQQLRSARVDPAIAYTMFRRDPTLKTLLEKGIAELGWSADLAKAWGQITHPRPAEQDLMTLFLRGEISEPELDGELEARGWLPEDTARLKSVRLLIPPVTDIIRLAVREAFNPEAISKFKLDSDFPAEVGSWAEKQGLSREWAMRYWVSHWEQPSISQAFEMLHRLRPGQTDLPFTEADLDLLLRIQDVAPYWRDRLKQISYLPFTRVDIRRMFSSGVLDVGQVYEAHRDIGYDDEHAKKLTEFVTRDVKTEEKGITRAAIQQAYKRKTMSRDEAGAALTEIGYSAEDTEFWLSLTDWEIEQDMLDEELKTVEFLFVEGEINEPDIYARLGKFNLPAEQLADLIRRWDIKKRGKVKLPAEGEVIDFYKRNIVDETILRDVLVRRKFAPEYVEWVMERVASEQVEEAAKDAKDAQEEQERIARATRATTYQTAVADLDVEAALARLEIANIKLTIITQPESAETLGAKERIATLQVILADLSTQKAEQRVALVAPIPPEEG